MNKGFRLNKESGDSNEQGVSAEQGSGVSDEQEASDEQFFGIIWSRDQSCNSN